MTDCDIEVDIDDPDPIELEVGSGSPIDVLLETLTPVEVPLVPGTAITVASLPATEIEVPMLPASAITAEVSPSNTTTELNTSFNMALAQSLIDKLTRLREVDDIDIPLWQLTEKQTVLGNSDTWTGTNAVQEIARAAVLTPAWRGSGVIETVTTVNYANKTGAAIRGSFHFEIANDFDPITGIEGAWTTVFSFTSQDIPVVAAQSGAMTFSLDIIAEGHRGTFFTYVGKASLFRQTLPAASPVTDPEQPTLTRATNVDPTKDMLVRLTFELSVAGTTDKVFDVFSSYANLKLPRDGHGMNH